MNRSLEIAEVVSPLEEYFCRAVADILRPAKGYLNHPYLVPGGLYADELWDWDSFWLAKGLFALSDALDQETRESVLRHAMGSWKNFMENQAPHGAVPIMVKSDNPDFFGCTKKGLEKNQAKPIFGQFAHDIAKASGDYSWIEPFFDSLLSFYACWRRQYGTPCGLLVWGSDVAIGVDSDPTTYGRPEFSSANLMLNCLYYQDLLAAAEIAEALHRDADGALLKEEAHLLRSAIQSECWDEEDGFFYTVDIQCNDHRDYYLAGLNKGMDFAWKSLPLKVKMFTGFLPMWCGIATEHQAETLVMRHLRNETEFQAPWGVPSLAKKERMYAPGTDSANPSNWLGPIWIVANYMIYEGLQRYGYKADAHSLADKVTSLLEIDLSNTGTLHECYHPETGEPNFNEGFLSWNVLTVLMDRADQTKHIFA